MTSSFKDPEGREWKLRLTTGIVGDVERETKVDIGSITKSEADWMRFLFGDHRKLVSVLWVLCESQAKSNSVTPEQFGYLFDGTTLEAAGFALAGAIADFFPRTRVAKAIRDGLEEMIAATDEKLVTAINAQTEAYCKSATNSPESAESIPLG